VKKEKYRSWWMFQNFERVLLAAVKKVLGDNCGPEYLFLTHVDDTAQHNDWKNEFPSIRRMLVI
jgi:hypothetical protein